MNIDNARKFTFKLKCLRVNKDTKTQKKSPELILDLLKQKFIAHGQKF